METKRTHSPLAVLSGTKPVNEIGFAALSLESDSDGWYQLLPAGHFKAVDGRPFDVAGGQWFLDESTALSLIADLKSRINPTVIDYEHQTLLADQNGQPAPASGWIKDAQWRESGLWIKADWTGRAADYIKGGEYCYLSAVFPYDKQTGKPLSLHSAALVNRPGLDGLNAVALRSLHISTPASQQEDTLMDRAKLIAALGLTDAATDDDILASLKQLQDDKQTATSELATLKANPPTAQVDLTKYAPVEVVDSLKSELAALSQKATASEIEALVVDAINEGRLSNSEKDWAIQMGQQNLVALKTRIQERPPIAALKGMQAGHETPPPKDDAHGLTKDELEAAKLTGKTPEQYAALKAAK